MYYRKVEGVAANDLTKGIISYYSRGDKCPWVYILGMGSRTHSRVDERIRTFYGQLRAGKPKHVLRRDRLAQKGTGGESVPKHDDVFC